jgi:endonuclease-3
MPATMTKQKLLTHLLGTLKKQYDTPAEPERNVLEQLIYALLRENAARKDAEKAYRNLRERFFDWNEVRVSSIHEIANALVDLPQPVAKAQRVIGLLQEVFEANYSFDLDGLPKKGVKPAARQIARYQATSDFTVSWVTLKALDGHAVPLDEPSLRTLKRLGVVEQHEDNLATVQASMEHHIPKIKATLFIDLLNGLSHDRCLDTPRCNGCPLKSDCNHAVTRPAESRRPKPR